MEIKVFIPSYKRLNSIKYVIYSLLQAELPINCVTSPELYIINNWPKNKEIIQSLVSEILESNLNSKRWNINIINREKTIDPAYSWYNAIIDSCNDGDIVFLSGDDDLFTQDSIINRVNIMNENPNCQILISSFHGGLTFNQQNNNIYFDLEKFKHDKSKKNNKIENLKIDDTKTKSSIFLGNNCYRFGEIFKKSVNKAFSWCDQLHWLDSNTRTLMIPYYISIAVAVNEGKIKFIDNIFIIRGVDYNEPLKSSWGISGWNCGFLELTSLCVLNNGELKKYSDFIKIKKTSEKIISEWYFTFFFDSRISQKSLKMTIKNSGSNLQANKLKGILMLIKQILRHIGVLKFIKRAYFKTPLITEGLLLKSI